MPLVAPVPLLPATQVGDVHFIAIGGTGMSAIAALYAELGVRVTGSDQADSAALRQLRNQGVTAHVGHDAAHLGDAETVVVSSAVRESNVELAEARRRGLRVWHRSAALGALMLERRGIAVTGTHGKTTTSAMIAVLLAECGADPSYVIGSPLTASVPRPAGAALVETPSLPAAEASGRSSSVRGSRIGGGEAFVIEADESDGSFLQYPAEIVVVTNIEADHLDNWGTPQAYADGFVRLALQPGVRTVVLDADDPGTRKLAATLAGSGKQVVRVGESEDADVRISDLGFAGATAHAVLEADGDVGPLELAVPGRHNLHNAAFAYAVGRALGLDGARLRAAAAAFNGTHRRFQRVAEVDGVTIVDDYAHHPTEVVATLTAARVYAGDQRVVACFQPHLFTRTRDFATEFARALTLADQVVVLGIYPAREDPIPGVTGELVADALRELIGAQRVRYVEPVTEAPEVLAGLAAPGDLVVTLGAGDVTGVGPVLAKRLRERR
ncbi:MAG: UDP-N-acetylmuramate--L-alanine ligase [Propionibacteriaceae bacterium]|nr:UDP-N-acetylmuramate--L-alanine ligase [Propionibacteriaceae bacterium]